MGNIRSLKNSIEFLGFKVKISNNPKEIYKADFLIIPGVGAFNQAISNLNSLNLIDVLKEYIFEKKKYVLGICLGMQLLCEKSEEHGSTKGLNCVDLQIKKFKKKPVFHIGYNQVMKPKETILFKGVAQNSDFYFVHSFRAKYKEKLKYNISTSVYGEKFISSFENNNIFGTQFHPEKSQINGLNLIKNFLSQ